MFAAANQQLSLLEELQAESPALSEEQATLLACTQLLQEAEAEPPIPVERIASLRGIVDVVEGRQDWAGMLAPAPRTGFVVTVRAGDGHDRQRFTICHEVAHTFFPGFHQQRQFRCNGAKSRLEQLCDFAASELLLPRSYFTADLHASGSFDFGTVEDLARRYQASIEATALRTVDLWAAEPAVLLVLRRRHKPAERGREALTEPRLRLDYAHASGTWPYALAHKSVSDDSPLAAAFEGELVDIDGAVVDELFSLPVGPVELHAKRYGADGRVLALIRRKRGDNG